MARTPGPARKGSSSFTHTRRMALTVTLSYCAIFEIWSFRVPFAIDEMFRRMKKGRDQGRAFLCKKAHLRQIAEERRNVTDLLPTTVFPLTTALSHL